MHTHRPAGVTPIGILNIVFGALGTFVAALIFFVGGLAATAGSTWESQQSGQVAADGQGTTWEQAGQTASTDGTGGATWESASGNGPGAGGMIATGGAVIMVIGGVALVCWLTLLISGIGVLKLASWGRTLSLVCGVGGLLLQVTLLFLSGFEFNLITYGAIGYCGLLVYLFTRPEWKAAFTGGGDSTGTHQATTQPSDQRYRHAA